MIQKIARFCILIMFFLFILTTSPLFGQPKNTHDRLLEFFAGACLQTMPDIARIKAGARVMEWMPLEGDVAAMVAPAEKGAVWQGWAVKTDEDMFMVGISEGSINGDEIATCTVTVREINQIGLVQNLQNQLNLKLIADEKEAFQRYRAWQTKINDIEMVINLTTYYKDEISPATISVMTYKN